MPAAEVVLPGDQIAVAEEYEPGDGAYEHRGHIYAAVPGVLEFDHRERIARVRAFNPLAKLKEGDIVYSVVDEIRGSMMTATVVALHGRKRAISGDNGGSIHISKVSQSYTEDIRKLFRVGDIIRAKVIQAKPSLQLTTADRNLGTLKAMCGQCRGPMVQRGRDLYCPRCERFESRKIADDYDDPRLG